MPVKIVAPSLNSFEATLPSVASSRDSLVAWLALSLESFVAAVASVALLASVAPSFVVKTVAPSVVSWVAAVSSSFEPVLTAGSLVALLAPVITVPASLESFVPAVPSVSSSPEAVVTLSDVWVPSVCSKVSSTGADAGFVVGALGVMALAGVVTLGGVVSSLGTVGSSVSGFSVDSSEAAVVAIVCSPVKGIDQFLVWKYVRRTSEIYQVFQKHTVLKLCRMAH